MYQFVSVPAFIYLCPKDDEENITPCGHRMHSSDDYSYKVALLQQCEESFLDQMYINEADGSNVISRYLQCNTIQVQREHIFPIYFNCHTDV